MNILEAATNIISAWEHTGHYDCHGNGAYGLIGWQGNELITLLQAFENAGGKLAYSPSHYAKTLIKDRPHTIGELNDISSQQLMQRVQREQAGKYIERAIKWQWKFYPFATPLGQLVCADIGVNSGINNWYVKHCKGHLLDSERVMLHLTMSYRMKALDDYGLWSRYPGLRRRWNFYNDMIETEDLDLSSLRPSCTVNGVDVELGSNPIEPLKQ